MFKWTCLGVASVGLLAILWMLNDLRLETQRAVRTINEHLPEIVEKTRRSTDTLAELSEDVRQLKDLAGVTAKAHDEGMVAYADSVLQFLENSPVRIGTKKLLGKGLSDPVPAREWCVGARKKAVLLLAISTSKQDFLTRLGDKVLGTQWYVQAADGEPERLVDWLHGHHPESRP